MLSRCVSFFTLEEFTYTTLSVSNSLLPVLYWAHTSDACYPHYPIETASDKGPVASTWANAPKVSFWLYLLLDLSKNVSQIITPSSWQHLFSPGFQDNTFYWLSSYLNYSFFLDYMYYFLFIPNHILIASLYYETFQRERLKSIKLKNNSTAVNMFPHLIVYYVYVLNWNIYEDVDSMKLHFFIFGYTSHKNKAILLYNTNSI